MKPAKQVIEELGVEKAELIVKIERLAAFVQKLRGEIALIGTTETVSGNQYVFLCRQLNCMKEYEYYLGRRIEDLLKHA